MEIENVRDKLNCMEAGYGNMDDNIARAYEKADRLGLDVVVPSSNEVFIDIDSDDDAAVLEDMLSMLEVNNVNVTLMSNRPSISGHDHRHVVLQFDRDLSDLERVALQACMGSDRKRELLAILRIWNENSPVTLFFEKKYEGGGNG